MKALLTVFFSDATEEIHANQEAVNATPEEHDEENQIEETDYSRSSKQDLEKSLKHLLSESNVSTAFNTAKKIKSHLDLLLEEEKNEALQKFIANGGEEDDFEFTYSQQDKEAESAFRQLRERFSKHLNELNSQKDVNLRKKQTLLETLRELVNNEETNLSFNKLKEIQEEWKKIGQVPADKNQALWDNYHALINRFYDKKTIFDELKELDRRKNLELKAELCDKAEKLADEQSLNKALRDLNELHQEFKHLGPIPKESQEEIWNRFKAASDKIYERKKEYLLKQDEQQKLNEQVKEALLAKLQELVDFSSDRIDAWNKRSDEIIAIREEWNKIGFIAKEKAKDVNKQFWTAFKHFFNSKKSFYRQIDAVRDANLKAKEDLVTQVEQLLIQETVTDALTEEVKNLQKKWKEIGAVPNKKSNEIFERFKKACDAFFDKKRGANAVKEEEFKENLDKKLAICEKVEKATTALDLDEVQSEWDAIGFVPKNEVNKIKARFMEAVEKYLDKFVKDEDERTRHKLIFEVASVKGVPDARLKLQKKEQVIKNKIKQVENDIAIWVNNMEFFAKSKNAESLKAELVGKIDEAKVELKKLKDQLYILKSV